MSFFARLFGGNAARNVPQPVFTNVTNRMVQKASNVEVVLEKYDLNEKNDEISSAVGDMLRPLGALQSGIKRANVTKMASDVGIMVSLVQEAQNLMLTRPSSAGSKVNELKNMVPRLGSSFDQLRNVGTDCDEVLKALRVLMQKVEKTRSDNLKVLALLKEYEAISLGTASDLLYQYNERTASGASSRARMGDRENKPGQSIFRGVARQ